MSIIMMMLGLHLLRKVIMTRLSPSVGGTCSVLSQLLTESAILSPVGPLCHLTAVERIPRDSFPSPSSGYGSLPPLAPQELCSLCPVCSSSRLARRYPSFQSCSRANWKVSRVPSRAALKGLEVLPGALAWCIGCLRTRVVSCFHVTSCMLWSICINMPVFEAASAFSSHSLDLSHFI